MEIGLHHDRVEGLVDAAAPLQQGGEERPGAELGDLQVQVAGGGRERPGPGAVSLGRAGVGAFEWSGADESGRFGVDELLVERFGRETDPVARRRYVAVERGARAGQTGCESACVVSFVSSFDWFSLTIARWLLTLSKQRPS